MWVVRWGSGTINMFCLVAGPTRQVADQRGAEQIKRGTAQKDALVQSALRGENVRSSARPLFSKELRTKQLAGYLTAQVEREMATLSSVLQDGLALRYSLEIKDYSIYPVPVPQQPRPEAHPPEPSPASYSPDISLLSSLIPSVRLMRLADAEERYRAARTAWEQSKAATEKRIRDEEEKYQHEFTHWEEKRKEWVEDQTRRNAAIDEKKEAYSHCEPPAVTEYCQALLKASPYPYVVASRPEIALGEAFSDLVSLSEYPDTFPRTFELAYVLETRTMVVDYALPPRDALPSVKGYKYVASKDEIQPVPAAQAWLNEIYGSVLYQVTLRTIYELFRWDEAAALDSVVFNGWVNSIDKATGKEVNACVLTIQASKREFLEINLALVDPKACFRKLKGISAAKLAGLSAVRPILEISREDKRFIASRPVVDAIDSSTNLAAIDWEDFEQLIREVFEKEFSVDGGEVKITRASRDHGVDAVAFDPDPIRGGKIVIQAKRYTDTVSVSAVRDLYGTILNEGANKGILVTTADYGPDSYEFAKGKPITLLNGSELLYLLQKHGHKARIDLAEARFLVADKERNKSGPHG